MCFFKRNPKPIGPAFNPKGYKPVFIENFLNPINWNIWDAAYPGGQNQKEKTIWTKNSVEQWSDGVHLIAKKGDGVNLCGQLCSHKFLETLYGYISFTAKMPPKGLLYFPALWGYNKNGWQPEIDVVELAGGESNELWFTHHYVLPPDVLTDHSKGINRKWEKIDFSKGFHEFSVEWTPDKLTWYVDGFPYFEATENIPSLPIFWVMGIQAGYGPPFTHLFTEQESGQRMIVRRFEVWQK